MSGGGPGAELDGGSRFRHNPALVTAIGTRAGLDNRGRLSLRERSFAPLGRAGRPSPHELSYSPPTVRPSRRIVGAATLPRNSRALPISEIFQNMFLSLPATLISSTG